MTSPLADCCLRYVRHALDCRIEWATEARRLLVDDPANASDYIHALEGYDHAGDPLGIPRILSGIVDRGEPCPWHDRVPEDYIAVMQAMGAPDAR